MRKQPFIDFIGSRAKGEEGEGGSEEVIFCPLSGFVRALCDGWSLPFVVEPMAGHHGHYAVLMWRAAA